MNEIESQKSADVSARDPGVERVYRFLMYGLSVPERAVRSSAAMLGGTLHESASLLVPQAFRDSKTYRTFVAQMLDVVSSDVGGVKREVPGGVILSQQTKLDGNEQADPSTHQPTSAGVDVQPTGPEFETPPTNPEVENYVARKTVSTFIDLAGMATLHVSPLTILAIVSDVAYGSKTYLHELSTELKREGIIAEDSSISNTADLLDAIGAASAETADVFDTPPISVDGLRETIQQTRDSVAKIAPSKLIPQSEIVRMWSDMRAMADHENVSVFEVSSAMTMYAMNQINTATKGALTTLRVTGNLLDQHLFDHYWQGLRQIGDRGIYTMAAESSRPYIDAVWFNFSSDRATLTEDIFSGRMAGRVWRGFCDWMK